MNPATHLLASWALSTADPQFTRRDRILITVAGIVPDIDGFGPLAWGLFCGNAQELFSTYHHILSHNLVFALLVAVILATVGRAHRWRLAIYGFAAVHLHLLCDLMGSRGPDGWQWPIPYLWPFTDAWQLTWSGQWELTAWPNFVITIALMIYAAWHGIVRGTTSVEVFSQRLDMKVVERLRIRGKPFARH